MATRMQQRRGTAAQWTGANPTLAAGEIGYETDTGKFKIGNGSSTWSALNYYVDANAILDGAPGVLDTLNELAAAIGDDPAFFTTVATDLSDHTTATTNVHGIADTDDLATKDYVNDAVSGATVDQSGLAGAGIDWNSGTEQFDIDSTVVTLTGAQTLTNKTLTSPDLQGTPTTGTASAGSNNNVVASTEYVDNAVAMVINSAPSTLNTLKELSDALGADANFSTTVSNSIGTKVSKAGDTMTGALTLSGVPTNTNHAATKGYVDNASVHSAVTTNVHGISDTANLVYQSDLTSHATDTTSIHGITDTANLVYQADLSAHSLDTTSVHGIADTSALVLNTDLTAHNNDTTGVHGIADTADLVLTDDSRLSDERTPSDDSVTTVKILDGAVTTAKLANNAVTSGKIADGAIVNADINSAAAIDATKISGTAVTLSDSGTVATAMIANGAVTSDKIADGTIQNSDIHATAAIDWTKLAVSSTVSATELGYVDGVTSSIQTQLDAKLASATAASTYAPIASPTFTGTVSGVTKSMVGLGNVDNTSDANKPVSTATQTALDAKAPLASPTFTGTVTLPTGTVTSGMILDGTIVNGDISSSAAIALSKLATDPLARANHTGTQTASTISDFDTQVRTSKVTDLTAPTGSFSMNSQKITNLSDPTADQDAATKAYVDAATAGLNVHQSVKAATTANITLATAVDNGKTLDGVTLATGNRILVKNQTTQSQNGIYIVAASGAPTRATDYDSTPEVDAGDFIYVESGTVNGTTGWVQTNTITTVGTDAIAFTQFSGAGTYLAGTGLTLSGSTFSINTGTTADLTTAQTLTNKTINGSNNTITNVSLTTGVTGTLPVANGGTGVTTSTGSGNNVLSTSPTLVTPTLGAASATSIAFSDGTQSKEGVPSRTTINAQTGTTYTVGLTDRDSLVELNNASAITLSIPTNANTAFPVGTSIDILQTGAGQVTIAAVTPETTTVNATPGLKLRAQWSSATLFKRSTDTWVVMGDLSA